MDNDSNINNIKESFASDTISFSVFNDFQSVKVSNKFADAEILLYGAHIVSFTPKGSRDILWVSSKSDMAPGKPIRGGIPVCWPWFGPAGTPMHGIARISIWNLDVVRSEDDGSDTLILSLNCSDSYGLKVQASITIGTSLSFKLTTENVGSKEYQLTSALHSYFAVSKLEKVKVSGLDNSEYTDKVAGGKRALQKGDIIFEAETDSVYDQSDATVIIHDGGWNRSIRIEKAGSNSTVVWNPWIDKSKNMADFADNEYHKMLCVEAGNVGADARNLQPEETHTLFMRISQV